MMALAKARTPRVKGAFQAGNTVSRRHVRLVNDGLLSLESHETILTSNAQYDTEGDTLNVSTLAMLGWHYSTLQLRSNSRCFRDDIPSQLPINDAVKTPMGGVSAMEKGYGTREKQRGRNIKT